MRKKSIVFEDLVELILKENCFKEIIKEPIVSKGFFQYDFKAEFKSIPCAIEVKYYRSKSKSLALIRNAARQLSLSILDTSTKGILIVSVYLQPDEIKLLEDEFGLVILHQADVYNMAQSIEAKEAYFNIFSTEDNIYDFKITSDFYRNNRSQFNEERFPLSSSLETINNLESRLNKVSRVQLDSLRGEEKVNKGKDLIKRLNSLKPGREDSLLFEKLSIEIIDYLFENNLYEGEQQIKSHDGLHRYDYIARIKSNNYMTTGNMNFNGGFWSFITGNLNSIYMIFESKNYTDEITQKEILTTEKYLYVNAFRKVAIIITRKGADNGAKVMVNGAMREHGKLILILDDNDIIKMIKSYEVGNEPSELLFERLDDLLMGLSR